MFDNRIQKVINYWLRKYAPSAGAIDREELQAEAYLAVCKARNRYPHLKEEEFIKVIQPYVRYAILEHYRRYRSVKQWGRIMASDKIIAVEYNTPDKQLIYKELLGALELNKRSGSIIHARLEGYSFTDIAIEMGVSRQRVEQLMRPIRKRAKEILNA